MEQKLNPTSDIRFALLIDSDNVSAKYIKPILDELSKYGSVTYKRIYGDWTSSLHAKWKDALLENSITPIQQFSYTYGKNATDSAMIIDAMDILYTDSVEGFCIVSSDSDFTRLASRLRESGRTVIGMGEKKTPKPFRRACDIFTTLELLEESAKAKGRASNNGNGVATAVEVATQAVPIQEIEAAVVKIITDNQNNGKATGLGEVGSRLLKRYPDFDVRSYGTNLLSKLLDGFKSVAVIKDGSNVDVVLADEAAGEGTEPAAPKAVEAEAEAAAAEPAETAEAAEDAEGADHAETKNDASEDKQSEGKSRNRRRRRNRSTKVAAEDKQAETEDKAEPEQAEQIAQAEESVAEEKPAEAEVKKAKGKKAEPKAEKKPAEKKPAKKPAKKTAPQTPDDYAKKIISDAGEDGILMAALGKKIRSKFRDFKLKDLGYSKMRDYISHLDGIAVRKVDGEDRAFAE